MNGDEHDLYSMALDEDFIPSLAVTTSAPSPIENPTEIQSTSKGALFSDDHAELFRKLLIGSRSQIEKLKTENRELQTNLENAINSNGTVVCPHCQHQFKERQHLMRPRAMRKMRARNCVELEFNTLDDLQSWLYLNQLETNNDGMPTVMNVKKANQSVECSLRTAGSLLPDLVEKRKERMREEAMKQSAKDEYDGERRERKERVDRTNDRTITRTNRRNTSNTRETKERVERDHTKETRESRHASSYSSKSPARREHVHENKIRQKERTRKEKEAEQVKEKSIGCSTKTESYKRKLSSEDIVRDTKIRKPTIAERIKFPDTKKDEVLETLSEKNSKTEKESLNTHRRSFLADESTSQSEKSKKAPIVWKGSKDFEENLTEPKSHIPFEFKVKSVEKKKEVVSQVITSSKTKTNANCLETTVKYKFVPTSKKKIIIPSELKENANLDNSSAQIEEHSPVTIQTGNYCPLKEDNISTANEVRWKLRVVIKTPNVLNHINQRAAERKNTKLLWSGKMIVLNGDELQKLGSSVSMTDFENNDAQPIHSSRTVLNGRKQLDSERKDHQKISDSLKRIGVSDEGIAVLKKRLQLGLNPVSETIELEDKISEEQFSVPAVLDNSYVSAESIIPLDEHGFSEFSEANTSEYNHPNDKNMKNDDDEGDALDEFFPDLANMRARQARDVSNVDSSSRPFSTGSFGSIGDREEDELTRLIREDSAAPPGGDNLMDLEDIDYEQTMTQQNEEEENENEEQLKDSSTQNSDWKEFCLEDLDEEEDETTREAKLAEMEKSYEGEEGMEWLANLEDDDVHIFDRENSPQLENNGEIDRSESVPLEMKSEFRLSDEEDLISPMTSTPRREDSPDDISEPPDDEKEELKVNEDSFIDELDWNYGTDYEGDDQNEANEKETMEIVAQDHSNPENRVGDEVQLEEGEISSEDEKVEVEETKKKTKKPIRERIQYFVEKEQVSNHDEEDRSRRRRESSRSDKDRSHRVSTRRRSSEENRHHKHKRDDRPATYRSMLKRRN